MFLYDPRARSKIDVWGGRGEAGKWLGVNPQAVSNAITRGSVVQGKYRVYTSSSSS